MLDFIIVNNQKDHKKFSKFRTLGHFRSKKMDLSDSKKGHNVAGVTWKNLYKYTFSCIFDNNLVKKSRMY